MIRNLFIISIFLSLASCSFNSKKTIDFSNPGHDEYSAEVTKSLEIPPHFELDNN